MMSNEALKPMSDAKRRWGRTQGSRPVDPYKNSGKLRSPTVCPQCGAIYAGGRWRWGPRPANAGEEVCQACHRSDDGFPAGVVTLSGSFVMPNRVALVANVRQQEQSERRDRPPNRIINIEQGEDRIVVNTTDVQLPVRIGEAIRRTFQGALERHFDENSYLIRVDWHRDV
ncbi:MAG TPA: BCAM0308 family protein [Stellaceae bacterium]|nr:BCAM0308 family protein [Stellaceae bacterium]